MYPQTLVFLCGQNSFSDLNSKLEGASNLSISTLGKSVERASRLEKALEPLVGSQKAVAQKFGPGGDDGPVARRFGS